MNRTPEVYELIRQLSYFYEMAFGIQHNIEKAEDPANPNMTASTIHRFNRFKAQIDEHISEIIDELQRAKNGAQLS